MNVEFKNSFLSDLRKIKNEKIVLQVKEIIDDLLVIEELNGVKNLKKLTGFKNAYRIRVGNFRIGLLFVHPTIILSRILNRKEIYKYFPK